MGYMQQFEAELRTQLATGDTEAIVRWVKQKVYESYEHGLKSQGAKKRPARKPETRSEA
jgi:hypothetical protein